MDDYGVEREKVLGSLVRTAYSRLEMPPYFHLPWFIFFVLYFGFLIWCWAAYFRSKPSVLHSWRAAVLLVGLLCATLSVALNLFLYVHALYTGGYPLFHSVELRCIRWGTLTALLGIVAASVGKGRGRTPLAAISVLNLVLWFAAGMAQ
jgi:hypothetical protein